VRFTLAMSSTFTISIHAPGAAQSPQTVTVNCP
jgi:hypothetical protein